MEFNAMSAEEYRNLDAEAFNARRQAVIDWLDGGCDGATVEELRSEATVIAEEAQRRNAAVELRNIRMAQVAGGAGTVLDGYRGGTQPAADADGDPFDTTEYRHAFMEYCQRGTAIPMELRVDAFTTTADVPPQVPTVMSREIVKKMSEYGDIWNRVRKISVQGGTWFRVIDLKPTAKWIGESEVSDFQKVENDAKISFSFFQLECRMAQSLLASAVTFDDFQAQFVPAVAEAMVRALEQAIVRGDGTAGPLGVIKDTRITAGQIVEMTAAEFADWKEWHKKVKAVMPKSYRNGEFIMCQSTFDRYIETMSDTQNAPVSIGYNPVTGEEIHRLVGKHVTTVEPDILPDFDSASAGDVVAIFGSLDNYLVNTQPGMPMSIVRWIDHDSNKEKMKSLLACDGKILDPYGFILIKKKASA